MLRKEKDSELQIRRLVGVRGMCAQLKHALCRLLGHDDERRCFVSG